MAQARRAGFPGQLSGLGLFPPSPRPAGPWAGNTSTAPARPARPIPDTPEEYQAWRAREARSADRVARRRAAVDRQQRNPAVPGCRAEDEHLALEASDVAR